MDRKADTLMHLRQFKALIEETIHVEIMFRQHLRKKRPVNCDDLISQSKSYQVFLERMIEDVFNDTTL